MPDSANIATPKPQTDAPAPEQSGTPFPSHRAAHNKPAFPDRLTDSIPRTATPLKPVDTYPLIEQRQGIAPESPVKTAAHSSAMMALLVVSFLLIAYCYRKGFGYFHKLSKSIWSVKRTENHLDEHTTNETILLGSLIAVTVIMEAIIVHSAVPLYFPGSAAAAWAADIYHMIAAAAACYAAQVACVGATGYIFSENTETRLWIQGFNSTQVFMGIALTPVAITMLFVPSCNGFMVFIAIALYIIARLAFYAKSVRLFYSNIFQCFYFISYLCALEIAPLALLYNSAFRNL